MQPNAPGSQGYNRYAYVANNPTTWTDPSGQSTLTEDPVEVYQPTPMPNNLEIAEESAAELAAVICSTRICSVDNLLLIVAVGVLACIFDINGPCWTWTPVGYTARLVARYGSAAAAGAWTLGVTAMHEVAQTFPASPTVNTRSADPNQQKREAPAPPQSDEGNDDQCQAAKEAAAFDVSTFGVSPELETHLEEHKPSSRVDGNGHFSQAAWSIKTDIIRDVLKFGHAHLNPSPRGRADCEVTLQFPHTVGTDGNGNKTQTVAVYIDYDGRIRSAYPIPDLALRP